MKAISIKQPWADLIAHGIKTIETRTWTTNHRGELLIVSSKTIDEDACRFFATNYPGESEINYIVRESSSFVGVSVALVNLYDVRNMCKDDEDGSLCRYHRNLYSWILRDARKVCPVQIRGKLGIYNCNKVIELSD